MKMSDSQMPSLKKFGAFGDFLGVTARRRGGGKTLYMASAEGFDSDGNLVAMGEAVCRYARGSGDPEGIPPGSPGR